jgi:hypothetical protein
MAAATPGTHQCCCSAYRKKLRNEFATVSRDDRHQPSRAL